jgi:hypothetical protein
LKTLQENNPIVIRTDEQMQAVTAGLLEAAETALPERPVFLLLQRIEGAADLAPEDAAVVARGPQFTLRALHNHQSHDSMEGIWRMEGLDAARLGTDESGGRPCQSKGGA